MLEQFCFISEPCKQIIALFFSSSSCFPSPSVCVPGRVKMNHLLYLLQRSGRRSEEALRKQIRRRLEQVGGVWCTCWDTELEYIMPRQEPQQLFSAFNPTESCSLWRLILLKTIISEIYEVLHPRLCPVEDVLILLDLESHNPDISKDINTFMLFSNLLFFPLSCLFMPYCCLQEHSLLRFSPLILSLVHILNLHKHCSSDYFEFRMYSHCTSELKQSCIRPQESILWGGAQ